MYLNECRLSPTERSSPLSVGSSPNGITNELNPLRLTDKQLTYQLRHESPIKKSEG